MFGYVWTLKYVRIRGCMSVSLPNRNKEKNMMKDDEEMEKGRLALAIDSYKYRSVQLMACMYVYVCAYIHRYMYIGGMKQRERFWFSLRHSNILQFFKKSLCKFFCNLRQTTVHICLLTSALRESIDHDKYCAVVIQ